MLWILGGAPVAYLALGQRGGGIAIARQHHLRRPSFLFATGLGDLVLERGLTASAKVAGPVYEGP